MYEQTFSMRPDNNLGRVRRMSHPDPDQVAAHLLPGEEIKAAGVFGLQDNALLTGGAVAGGALAADILTDSALAAGVAGAAAGHLAREANAKDAGVSVAMLVVVTADAVNVFDWDHREGASKPLARFPLATTTVTVTDFGAARRVSLRDNESGYTLPLTGGVGLLSTYHKWNKRVIAALPALPAPG